MQLLDPGPAYLTSLPDELVLDILQYLELDHLFQLAQSCRWGYRLSIPLLWKDVELKDCWSLHPRGSRPQLKALRVVDEYADEHDDTPIIKKLLVLATKPVIASHVQTVLHRCHLPTPSIYHELPLFCFRSLTLSHDRRTHKLLLLAIRNMTNVHTLRIIYGHYLLAYGLIWGFLHPHRPRNVSLKRLWLESCSLAMPEPGPIGSSYWPDLSGLTSLRIRRLSYLNDTTQRNVRLEGMALSRGNVRRKLLQNGIGGDYTTTIDKVLPDGAMSQMSLSEAARLDNMIYDGLPEAKEFLDSTHVPEGQQIESSRPAVPADFLMTLLRDSAPTLTSLNLDMLLSHDAYRSRDEALVRNMLSHLSRLRFPNLRAFQMRNIMTPWFSLPRGTYLLDRVDVSHDASSPPTDFLDFVEAHQNLKCLAWPMESFFSHQRADGETAAQQERVISNLSRTLTELRVDTTFNVDTESLNSGDLHSAAGAVARRWRFITNFASRMMKVEHLKMEGGIPREEKHETIRALWRCPLSKIVMIANANPIGNSWGSSDLSQAVTEDDWDLNEEDLNALKETASKPPTPPGQDFEFIPQYDWLGPSLMLHTVASFHADTVVELKLCGYVGAPILFAPTELSHPLLLPLRHFHNLRNLTMSMWLDTNFEGSHRDEEIIQFWINTRDPDTTALVAIVPDDSSDSDFNIEDSDDEDAQRPQQPRPITPPDAADPELQFFDHNHLQHHEDFNIPNLSFGQQPPLIHPSSSPSAQPTSPPAQQEGYQVIHNLNPHSHQHQSAQPQQQQQQQQQHQQQQHQQPVTHQLVAVTGDPVTGPEPILASSRPLSWPRRLHSLYAPQAIANQVASQIGPYLSERAKGGKGGVVVRVSFCLGHAAGWGTVFDIDVGVGEGDRALWWEGPREEGERRRWWGKVRGRRWF